MGYYDNPPIINMNPGADKIAAGFASGANAIAEALIKRGDRKRQEEKEQKLTLEKLREQKNKTDLFYNDKLSDWSKDQPNDNPISDQSKLLLQEKIKNAADARIALTMESDSAKRAEYLKVIRDADGFMDVASRFSKGLAGELATYKTTPGIAMNTPGGIAVNASDEELESTTDALNVLSGLTQRYKEHKVELIDKGSTFAVKVSGVNDAGKPFEKVVNATDYISSENGGTGGFLQKVEDVGEFRKQALKDIVDPKTNEVLPGFLDFKTETVSLPSAGGDKYQLIGARRLNEVGIRNKLKEQAEIKAAGYIRGGDTSSTRALINSTLEMGPSYYDKVFKVMGVDQQKQELAKLLEENAFKSFVKKYDTTIENGKTVYWGGDSNTRTVPKEGAKTGGGRGKDKEQPTTYKTDYYREIISGYTPGRGENLQEGQIKYRTRKGLVDNLNKLSGATDKYVTREDLYARWASQPYKEGTYVTDKTIEQQYKEKGKDAKAAFDKIYPKAQVFVEKGANVYKPITGYNVNTAVGRVKLALDQTSDAGERKILQETLSEAKLMDWVKANPRKQGESEQAYANRASKSL